MSDRFRPYFLNKEYKDLFYHKALDSVLTSTDSSEKWENQRQYLHDLPYNILMTIHFIRISEDTDAIESVLLRCNLLQWRNSWAISRKKNING